MEIRLFNVDEACDLLDCISSGQSSLLEYIRLCKSLFPPLTIILNHSNSSNLGVDSLGFDNVGRANSLIADPSVENPFLPTFWLTASAFHLENRESYRLLALRLQEWELFG